MPISRGETKVLRERKGALCSGESGLLLHCTKVSLAAANGVVECLAEPLLRRCAPEVGSSTAFFFFPPGIEISTAGGFIANEVNYSMHMICWRNRHDDALGRFFGGEVRLGK